MNASSGQCRQRIEWMWKSNINDLSQSKQEEWHCYSDIETAIIEEAFQEKLSDVVLDDYHIDLKHFLQVSNTDENNRRPVKRTHHAQQEEERLREARFMSNPVLPSAPFRNPQLGFLYATRKHFNIHHDPDDDPDTRRMLIESAAEGFIIEGKNLGKQKEAEWLASQLINVKRGTAQEVWECCARLYCLESFLYKKMNEYMRLVGEKEQEDLWKNKVTIFGPFAFLLLWRDEGAYSRNAKMTVYRGAYLSDDLIEQYRQKCAATAKCQDQVQFPSFTSTSRNRLKAEQFGNVLFVIEITEYKGRDVSSYSEYDEEEHLLVPGFLFYVQSCIFDKIKNKWIIHLQHDTA